MNPRPDSAVRLFASARSWIESEAVRQLYALGGLPGVRHAVGFPDLHPGKGSPVGNAVVTEGMIYPELVGGDIGCGMALFKTNLASRSAKPDQWAEVQFDLERPGTEPNDDLIAAHDLESKERDPELGTLGGGNHFAELQAVEQVFDARACQRLGVSKRHLMLLVHSGSRSLGESIFLEHARQ